MNEALNFYPIISELRPEKKNSIFNVDDEKY